MIRKRYTKKWQNKRSPKEQDDLKLKEEARRERRHQHLLRKYKRLK